MKLTNIKRFSPQDVPGAPDWFVRFLDPLNNAIEGMSNAISGNLTFADNLFSFISTQTMTHNAAVSFLNPIKNGSRPIGIIPISALDSTTKSQHLVTGFGWQLLQTTSSGSSQISATAQFDAGGSTQCTVTMLVIGG